MFRRALTLGLASLLTASVARAQVACDGNAREVVAVDFQGNTTFRDDQLAILIETTPSRWVRRTLRIIGTKYCHDSTAVRDDALRLAYFYHLRGFRGTSVVPSQPRSDSTSVHVRFTIREGRPLQVDSLEVNGLDEVPVRERVLRALPLRIGDRLDRTLVDATRDSLVRRLRDNGYPTAEVFRNINSDTVDLRAQVWFDASPGPRMRIGEIRVTTAKTRGVGERVGISTEQVHRTIGLDRGRWFSQRELEAVKRALYLSDAYPHVDVSVDSVSLADAVDSLVTVNVNVVEGELHAARAAIGWGTYDCLRAQGNIGTVGLLGSLRRLDLSGRLSRVGSGSEFGSAQALCTPEVRQDSAFAGVNWYAGATYSQPPFAGRRVFPSLTLYSERRTEYRTYQRSTPFGALASLQGDGRLPVSLSYQLEFGRTEATSAYFCGVFNVCDRATIDLLGSTDRRTGTLGLAVVRATANSVSDPSNGYLLRTEVRHASPVVGSDDFVQFTRASVDWTWYLGVPGDHRFVVRARAGRVLADKQLNGDQRFVPPQERMYAGGPNTVRGFGLNQLGPLVYRVANSEEVALLDSAGSQFLRMRPGARRRDLDQPTGGDNVVVVNTELRLRSPWYPEVLQLAAFADAGDVWNTTSLSTRSRFSQLKVTPGLGVRVFTPIGPLRVDIAYGPRALPAGPVYYLASGAGTNGEVFCVSPGNTLPVTTVGGRLSQAQGSCPASFDPPPLTGFLRRLVPTFSIGQAF